MRDQRGSPSPDGVLESAAVEAERVWMTCSCGAAINRSTDDD